MKQRSRSLMTRRARALALVMAVVAVAGACTADSSDLTLGTRDAVTPRVTTQRVVTVATAVVTTEPASDPTAEAATPRPIPTVLPAPTATPLPTATPTANPTATQLPAAEPTAAPTATFTAEPQAEASTAPCQAGPLAAPEPLRPVYDVALVVDPVAAAVRGDMRVQFTPDLVTNQLVLRLWPNSPRHLALGGAMSLNNVTIDGRAVDPLLTDPTTAVVTLDAPLAPGESVQIEASFDLDLPGEARSRLSHRVDYQRLGSIVPLLSWEPGRGWAQDPPTSLFAESVSSPVADWTVSVDVPSDYTVLASGVDDGTGTWHLEAGRDFAISVGKFRLVSGTALAPDPVTVTVGVHETVNDDGQAYLDKVIDSLEEFSSRWGAYPWPSLTFAITPNLAGGIEFPTHIMQGPNTIGRTTSHEVGHMFFYSLVGNNQGAAPWLDEGLTSYAEFTYEGVPPGAYEIPVGGQGRATEPMTWWESRSDLYYRSVYSQTGFALQRLADRQTVDCALAHYVAQNAHDIATAEDFVAAFEPWVPTVREDLAALGVDLTGVD